MQPRELMDIVSPKLVSVIIPAFNRVNTLKRALDSVKIQKYRPLEVVIVDDNSTDETQSFLNSYDFADLGRTIIQNKTNKGIGNSRNIGIEAAKGYFIAFLDSDDEWIIDQKLSLQVKFLEDNNDYGFVATGWRVMNSGVDPHNFCFTDDNSFRAIALKRYPAHTSTWVMKRSVYDTIGGFWTYKCEDYEYILRIGIVTKCYCLPFITEKYQNLGTGEYQQNIIKCFFVGLFICIKYRNKYPNFVSSFLNRMFRVFLKIM